MRGQLRFRTGTPETAATAYARALADLLQRARPRELEVLGSKVFVRGGIFRPVTSWNLLVGVTSATIQADPEEGAVVIHYEIHVTELVVACCCMSLFGIPVSIATQSLFPGLPWFLLVWIWIFGMNYVLTRTRMASTFREAANQIVQGEKPLVDQSAG